MSNNFGKWPVPEGWDLELEKWEHLLSASGSRQATIETRIGLVRTLARALKCPPGQVTAAMIIEWAGKKKIATETRHSYYQSIKAFFSWYAAAHHVDDPAAVLPMVHRKTPPARPTPEEVYEDALDGAPPRTRLILRLAGEVGLRASEIAQIQKGHLMKDLLGYSLSICGKGGKIRIVPIPHDIYVEMREQFNLTGIWLFPGQKEGHLAGSWVGKLARRELRDGWTLHTLRHRFATKTYAASQDVLAVKELLGHESVDTTQRYIQSNAAVIRAAMLGARQDRYKYCAPLPADTAMPANAAAPALPAGTAMPAVPANTAPLAMPAPTHIPGL